MTITATTINPENLSLEALLIENARLSKLVLLLQTRIEQLTLELAILKRQRFGQSREAADLIAVQPDLLGPVAVIAADVPQPPPQLARTPQTLAQPRQQPRRELLPPNLPREIEVIDVPEALALGLKKIGEDSSERLAYEPGRFFVKVTQRPRYANPDGPTPILQAPAPRRAIPGGILDESLLAQIAIDKFADHLPLSRQIERCARLGTSIALSTITENLITIAEIWLLPIVNALFGLAQRNAALHVDETILPTLPEENATHRATQKTRLWTYLGEFVDQDLRQPIILYQYTDTKAGEHVRQALKSWLHELQRATGQTVAYLHADAASTFDALYVEQPQIRAVNCWAHARRKFYAIARDSTTKLFAHDAIQHIDQLFAWEREWQPLDHHHRRTQRQNIAVPYLKVFKTLLDDKLATLAPTTATAKAIAYLTRRWDHFTRYTEQGYLQLSNNAAERALRKAALGRKNFLFVGNARAGKAAAIYYSLIETAKANDIEPCAWLLRVLREMPTWPTSSPERIRSLLPLRKRPSA